jgi:pyruvate dehydrogenase E2 component (dihydrolipoamide acetyltransferase)
LQDADKKGLGTIAEVVKQLAQKARDNSLKPEDYKVYVLSRKVEMRSSWNRVIPGSADGQYEFGSFMSDTLSCDHMGYTKSVPNYKTF